MPRPLAVVIPAGGSGTRLWPRSRQNSPKQLLDIVTPGRTMLQQTVDRVCPDMVSPEYVFVITNQAHVSQVCEQLADTPPGNIVGEPVGRDSAPAIGLMAAMLEAKLGSDAIMVVLSADHVILDPAAFREKLRAAVTAAGDGYLVTLGIPPLRPDTGFGYIRRGKLLVDGSTQVYEVEQFREKPDKATAESYVRSGSYYWNAGIFICTVAEWRSLYKKHVPEYEPVFSALVKAIGTPQQDNVFEQLFATMRRISVDFAVVEHAAKVAVVPAQVGWNDVGSWSRLAEILEELADVHGVISVGDHFGIDTRDSLIYSQEKTVTTIGIEGLIIIDTPDALLVARKDRAEEVKALVDRLKSEGKMTLT